MTLSMHCVKEILRVMSRELFAISGAVATERIWELKRNYGSSVNFKEI